MDSFRFDEKYLSQIPAPRMLVNPSYRYLTVTEA
jgi:type I restriction enzyme R subunit